MIRLQDRALDLLCQCLRARTAGPAALRGTLQADARLWPQVLAAANAHYLTPALWVSLEAAGLTDVLPGDVGEFLEESARLNYQRNRAIKAQCEELVRALDAKGIQAILLKGAAQLFMSSVALRTRVMVDLDLLMRQEALPKAARVAAKLGYRVIHEHEAWQDDCRTLGRGAAEAALEFHRTVGQQRRLISVEAAYRNAGQVSVDGCTFYTLSPTDRVLHNIFHAAIQDRAHHLGKIPLRALHDLGLIREQGGAAIDWADIRRRMDAMGYGAVLSAYFYMAQVLFGQELPPGIRPGLRARLHLARCRLLRRSRSLRRIVGIWATVTHPFARAHYEYHYGEAPNGAALLWGRIKLAGRILAKHRHRLVAKLLAEYRKLYGPG